MHKVISGILAMILAVFIISVSFNMIFELGAENKEAFADKEICQLPMGRSSERDPTRSAFLKNVTLEYPYGGGSHTNVSIQVPSKAYIENASIEIRSLPMTEEMTWLDETETNFQFGQAVNVTISENLSISQQIQSMTNSTNWSTEDFNNTQVFDENVVLSMSEEMEFFEERRADFSGAASNSDNEVDIVKSSNGTIHLVYISSNGAAVYRRSFDDGLQWSLPHTLVQPMMTLSHAKIYTSPDDELHFFSEEQMAGGSTLIHLVSRDNGTTWNPGTLPDSEVTVRAVKIVWDSQGVIHGIGRISFPFPPFDVFLRYFNSTDGGNIWNGHYNINDSADAKPGMFDYDIALESDGRIHVVWSDERDYGFEHPLLYTAYSMNGELWSANKQIFDNVSSLVRDPKLLVGENDRIHVVYSDSRTGQNMIYYTRSDDHGSNYQNDVSITGAIPGGQSTPDAALSVTDALHVAWVIDSAGNKDIYYCNSTDHVSFTNPIRINNRTIGNQIDPSITLSRSGMPFIAWNDESFVPNRVYLSGKGTSYEDEGDVSGVFHLPVLPISIGPIDASAQVPAETNIEYYLSSSEDNSNWSPWQLTENGQSPNNFTPQRYVRWKAVLTTSSSYTSPYLGEFRVHYSAYLPQGQYISSIKQGLPGRSDYILDWTLKEHGSPGVTAYLWDEDVQGWMEIGKGQTMNLDPVNMSYMFELEGTTSYSPIIENVTLHQSALRLPSNVSIDFGLDGVTEWNGRPDPLDQTAVYFTSVLREAVNSFQGVGDLIYRMDIASETAGKIRIDEVNITLDRFPVLMDTFPPGNDVDVGVNETIDFSVNVTDADDPVLQYTWTMDGEVVSSHPYFNFTPGESLLGNHTVVVTIFDGHTELNYTWSVDVEMGNRAPFIKSRTPLIDQQIELGDEMLFGVNTIDPDGDNLIFGWKLNDDQVGKNRNNFTLDTSQLTGVGNYNLSLEIFDGTLKSHTYWNILVFSYSFSLDLNKSKLTLAPGDKNTINLTLANKGLTEVAVKLIYHSAGLHKASDGNTLSFIFGSKNGTYRNFDIMVDQGLADGTYKPYFNIILEKDGRLLSNESIRITVRARAVQPSDDDTKDKDSSDAAGPNWAVIIIVLILVIIVVGILIFLLVVKRKKGEQDSEEDPVGGEGPDTLEDSVDIEGDVVVEDMPPAPPASYEEYDVSQGEQEVESFYADDYAYQMGYEEDAPLPPEPPSGLFLPRDEGDLAGPKESVESAITISVAEEEGSCSVCFGKIKEGLTQASCPCGKMLHLECLKRVGECPGCGEKMPPEKQKLPVGPKTAGNVQLPVIPADEKGTMSLPEPPMTGLEGNSGMGGEGDSPSKDNLPVKMAAASSFTCKICFGVVKSGLPIVKCKCGKRYHFTCAERVGECPSCEFDYSSWDPNEMDPDDGLKIDIGEDKPPNAEAKIEIADREKSSPPPEKKQSQSPPAEKSAKEDSGDVFNISLD